MRILLVSNTYPPTDVSGVGTLVSELARRLDAAGHQVAVLTRRALPDDPWARSTGGPKLLFPLLAGFAWAGSTTARRADLVHVHESDGVVVALLLRLARVLGLAAGRARLLATLQVSYVRERRSVRAIRAGGVIVSRPTAGELLFAWLRAPLLAVAGRLTAALADAVVAPSACTATELEEDYGARVAAVIPNGVAAAGAEAPPAAVEALPADAPLVVFAGTLRTRKAVAVLLEAFAELRRLRPAPVLALIGDGPQRGALEAQAERLGISGGVRFVGAVSREAARAWLGRADVFCLPSIYEGLPLAILEAMAAAVPVVACDVSGNPDAVEDSVTGRLVAAEDAVALAAAIGELVGDPEAARRMGEAGRRRLEERFTIDAVAAAHVELFAATTGEGR